MIDSRIESSFIKQIELLKDIEHYSRTGSTEDRETLYQLVESINRLGVEIIPEVGSIISEIGGMKKMNSSVHYSPTKLSRKVGRAILVLEENLSRLRGVPPPSDDRPPIPPPDYHF